MAESAYCAGQPRAAVASTQESVLPHEVRAMASIAVAASAVGLIQARLTGRYALSP